MDRALQTAGFCVVADTTYDEEEECVANYAAQWIDVDGAGNFYCMRLMRKSQSPQSCKTINGGCNSVVMVRHS